MIWLFWGDFFCYSVRASIILSLESLLLTKKIN
jgi:hypothetical protein